jgi:hypothetical protein
LSPEILRISLGITTWNLLETVTVVIDELMVLRYLYR